MLDDLHIFKSVSFDYTVVAGVEGWTRSTVNHTSWVAVVIPTDLLSRSAIAV